METWWRILWATGSFDPETNLTYWGVGNAGPDYNGDVRPGDNLYTSTLVALDADSGKLKWHYQANPHNEFDWDAVGGSVTGEHDLARQATQGHSMGRSERFLLRAGSNRVASSCWAKPL